MRRGLVWGVWVVQSRGVVVVDVDVDEEVDEGAQMDRSWMRSRTVSFQRWPVE